jgi:glycosyltransferase involved in cell wall biosynthesis
VLNTVPVRPRFSVVIPVLDNADLVGRAVAAVLAQTFADHEIVVVDRGSTDDTLRAVRSVADRRVRILEEPGVGRHVAATTGIAAARGRWIAVLGPEDEVAPGWLARLGRIVDADRCGARELRW